MYPSTASLVIEHPNSPMISPSPGWAGTVVEDVPVTVVVGLTGVDSVTTVVVVASVVVMVVAATVEVVVGDVVEAVSGPVHAVMTRTTKIPARRRVRSDDLGCLLTIIGKFPTFDNPGSPTRRNDDTVSLPLG
jgi:hypothetical protein